MENFHKFYNVKRVLFNITDNLVFLKNDYLGITFNSIGSARVVLNFLISITIIVLFYLIGRKIKVLFVKEKYSGLDFFINIGLGYIVVGTGIAILGLSSLLRSEILFFYILFILVISIFPLSGLVSYFKGIFTTVINTYRYLCLHKVVFIGISLFILISFLRLIPPEIGEDSVGYHTDLPLLYLNSGTTIVKQSDVQHVIPIPQLGEMSYVITQFLDFRDASRYVHFMFYALIVLFLIYISKKNTKLFYLYPPILFITASVIIRHSSKANVDFQALFCWLLSAFILIKERKITASNVILSAILFGGSLSTKLLEIVFLPTSLAYIFLTQKNKVYAVKLAILFFTFSTLTSLVWYVRAYLITGSPVYPALSHINLLEGGSSNPSIFNYIGINYQALSYPNLVVYSPLFLIGLVYLIYNLPAVIKKLKNTPLLYFFIISTVPFIFIQYYLPRYLLNIYVISLLIVSVGIVYFCSKIKLGKYILFSIFCLLLCYYFINTIFILPYGFGWADKNKYLTRVLSQDSSSYYDFDHLFDKHISQKDLVATYKISGFYYANFRHIDIENIFDRNKKTFSLLKKSGVSKLLLYGGNINWFCKNIHLTDCNNSKYKLLVSYPHGNRYLYSLDEN